MVRDAECSLHAARGRRALPLLALAAALMLGACGIKGPLVPAPTATPQQPAPVIPGAVPAPNAPAPAQVPTPPASPAGTSRP